jgi:hypothetical protein
VTAAPVPGLPPGRLGAVAPVPLVGAAAILVALIVFTPVLLAPGPSPLAVRAELIVYRAIGSPTTEFDVHGYDPDVPYRWINLSLGTGFSWTGSCPSTVPTWRTTTGANELVASVLANATPVVVNATAVYEQGGSRTVYAGELAFDIVGFNTSGESVAYAPCPWTPSVSPAGSWSVSQGTLPIPLVNYGSGGPS